MQATYALMKTKTWKQITRHFITQCVIKCAITIPMKVEIWVGHKLKFSYWCSMATSAYPIAQHGINSLWRSETHKTNDAHFRQSHYNTKDKLFT